MILKHENLHDMNYNLNSGYFKMTSLVSHMIKYMDSFYTYEH